MVDFGGDDLVFAAARQADGKMVLVGDTSAGASSHDFAVARFNPDGSSDASFGVSGKTTVDFGGDDFGFAVGLAPDGRILVAGQTTGAAGVPQFAVARLNADGSPDASFGVGGTFTIPVGQSGGTATAVLLQSDGRIIVVGSTSTGATQHDFIAMRLNADGSLDTSFGTGGQTLVDFGGDDFARTAVLAPDGGVILAGDSTSGGGLNFAAARLNPDGSVDSAFGAGGKVTVDFGGEDGASAVVLAPDGKVLLAGDTTAGAGGGDLAVARLNADGSTDTSFGTGGETTVDFGGQDVGRAVALQPDGGIIIAGGTGRAGE